MLFGKGVHEGLLCHYFLFELQMLVSNPNAIQGYIQRQQYISGLENAVDNIPSNSRTSTKNSRIPQLLAKLLPHLRALPTTNTAGRSRLRLLSRPARNIQRHIAIVTRRWRSLVLRHPDIRPWENALLLRPLVPALPPLCIHVLRHGDGVVRHKCEVARVGGVVGVHGGGVAERGGDGGLRVGWWWRSDSGRLRRRGWRAVVAVRLLLVVYGEVVEGGDWWLCRCRCG